MSEEKRPQRHPGGRPSKYNPKICRAVQDLSLLGLTEERIAELLEITVETLQQWMARYPEFSAAIRAGKEPADAKVARSLYQRALGYTYIDHHVSSYQGEVTVTPVKKHMPPDTNAAGLWLRNRQRDLWRDKREVEHSGSIALGNLMDVIEGEFEDVTPEDAEAPEDGAGVTEPEYADVGAPDADSLADGPENDTEAADDEH